MKIKSIKKIIEWIFVKDEEEYNTYKTDGDGNWFVSMEDSWEVEHNEDKELDELFRSVLG